jgi:hypothetical protein
MHRTIINNDLLTEIPPLDGLTSLTELCARTLRWAKHVKSSGSVGKEQLLARVR